MKTSLRQEIKTTLIQRLQSLPLESKLPSDRDLAREFNVAFLTINHVMCELESEGYVIRRPRLGTYLASRERVVSSGSEHDGVGTVAVVYPNYFSYQYWLHVHLAEEFAIKHRLRVVEFKLNRDNTYGRVLDAIRNLPNLRGMLVMPVPSSLTEAALTGMDALGCPVVLLSTTIQLDGRANLYSLDIDGYQVGYLAMELLITKGHRRLAWVQNEPPAPSRYLKGMLAAVRDHGLRPTDLLCIGRGIEPWEDSCEAGYRLTNRLLDTSGATGAFFDSLSGLGGAQRAMSERGLGMPEHLSVITNGSQKAEEKYLVPAPTTLDWDLNEEMRLAFDIIQGRARPEPREVLFPVRVHHRESIAAPCANRPSSLLTPVPVAL